MPTTVTKLLGGTKQLVQEVHVIQWDGTDATEEITTNLSKIYAYAVGPGFGAKSGNTDGDVGVVVIDETTTTDDRSIPYIAVASGAITVDRLLPDNQSGALDSQNTVLFLYGV